jgi:hypothetical protein
VGDAVLHGVAPLSSTPLIKRDGWLILDRVIDAPVYQATLTWDGYWPSDCRSLTASARSQSRVPLVLAMKKAVDYLLIAKPVAINHLGIRRDCAVSLLTWPVVGSSL